MAAKAVALCREGQADILMKGNVNTDVILRAILDRDTGLGRGGLLSNITVFESPTEKRLMFMSDPAVNINPDRGPQGRDDPQRDLGGPSAGFCPAEGGRAWRRSRRSTSRTCRPPADAAVIAKMGESGQFGEADIAGPYALDIAVSPQAAEMQAHQRAGGRLCRHPALPRHQLGEHLLQVAGLLCRPRDRQRDDRREDARW